MIDIVILRFFICENFTFLIGVLEFIYKKYRWE